MRQVSELDARVAAEERDAERVEQQNAALRSKLMELRAVERCARAVLVRNVRELFLQGFV